MALELSIWKVFEDQMDNLYAVPEYKPEDVSVHISTIHGVKGLEYDAVFIPAFDKGTGRVYFASAYLVRISTG